MTQQKTSEASKRALIIKALMALLSNRVDKIMVYQDFGAESDLCQIAIARAFAKHYQDKALVLHPNMREAEAEELTAGLNQDYSEPIKILSLAHLTPSVPTINEMLILNGSVRQLRTAQDQGFLWPSGSFPLVIVNDATHPQQQAFAGIVEAVRKCSPRAILTWTNLRPNRRYRFSLDVGRATLYYC